MEMFRTIIEFAENFASLASTFASSIINFFTTPLSDTIDLLPDIVRNWPVTGLMLSWWEFLLEFSGLGSVTMFTFIFSASIIFIVMYSFYSWIIDLAP